MDARDKLILKHLQDDADTPLIDMAEAVHLSPSAVSRRILHLKSEGYIDRSVCLLNRARLNLSLSVFVLVKTSSHSHNFTEDFRAAIRTIPEIVEAHRLAGNVDYLLKIVVSDVSDYDRVYNQLISRVALFDVSAYISMETLKDEMRLPLR